MDYKGRRKILMIGTGGTISAVPTEEGLVPELTAQELIRIMPEIKKICYVDCLQLLNLDSTNMHPRHWQLIAETIKKYYEEYEGFVITHGTDTMAYTAAALSYLIRNSQKPIVLTGAQLPIMEEGSDARRNILDAFLYAADPDSHYVRIVFNGSVISGTRARKNFSKSFAAFESINFPEVARVQSMRLTRFIPDTYIGETEFAGNLDSSVTILKLVPGLSNDVMKYVIDRHDGLIIESFGVGGLPEYSDFYEQIRHAVEKGKLIVMTTQVPNEGSDLSVYQTGKVLKEQFDVLEAHDMTSEAAYAKLMWILGQTHDFKAAETLFYTPVDHDILF